MTPEPISTAARSWAEELASRLRLIQSGMVEDEVSLRRNFLADEVERALKPVPPSQRRSYLRAIAEHFPGMPTGEVVAAAAGGSMVPVAPLGLEEMADELCAQLPSLSPEARDRLAARFLKAGLEMEAPEAGGDTITEFWKRYGVKSAEYPHAERTLKLLAVLTEVFGSLDQLSWTLWRTLDAKSPYRKDFDFGKLAGPYLQGDTEVSTDQVRQAVEKTRKLLAALVGATGRAAHDFAEQHSASFSPETVEESARSEKGLLGNLDAVSWRKYKQLHAASATAPQIESAIQQAVARSAEDLMGGRAR